MPEFNNRYRGFSYFRPTNFKSNQNMKKLLPLFIGIFLTGALVAQSIPDGGFENWTSATWMDPTYFNTSNDQIFGNAGTAGIANVTQVSAGGWGSFGVQLETSILSVGYMIDGNANGGGFTGGIPYNQQATGISFYYKYAPNTSDTAAVLVIFKKAGHQIDSFFIKIRTAQTNYTLYTYSPSSLLTAPDTIILGAVSSIGALGGGSGHVGSIFTIADITFTGVANQPANLNGTFANWITNNLYIPTEWYGNLGAGRTTDAQSGTYALELQTITDQGSPYVGQVSTAIYPNNCQSNCIPIGGKPYAQLVDTLYFSYKYAPVGTDTAGISMDFYKGLGGTGHQFYVNGSITGAASTYTDVYIPFDLTSIGFTPDSVIVSIDPSAHNHYNNDAQYAPFVGTVFKVDNIYFGSQRLVTTGINTQSSTATGVKVYPNPAKDVLNFQFTNISGAAHLSVYDITGREIQQSDVTVNNTTIQVNTGGMSPGVYFYKVTTGNGSFENKFIKE